MEVGMIGSTDDDGIYLVAEFIKHDTVIFEFSSLVKFLITFSRLRFVHITHRYDVLPGDTADVRRTTTTNADTGDI